MEKTDKTPLGPPVCLTCVTPGCAQYRNKYQRAGQPAESADLPWRRKYCQEAVTCLFSAMHWCAASQQEQLRFVPSTSETEETLPNLVEIKNNLLFFYLLFLWKLCFPSSTAKCCFPFSCSHSFGFFKTTYLFKCLWRDSRFFIVSGLVLTRLVLSEGTTVLMPCEAASSTLATGKPTGSIFSIKLRDSSTGQCLCPFFN